MDCRLVVCNKHWAQYVFGFGRTSGRWNSWGIVTSTSDSHRRTAELGGHRRAYSGRVDRNVLYKRFDPTKVQCNWCQWFKLGVNPSVLLEKSWWLIFVIWYELLRKICHMHICDLCLLSSSVGRKDTWRSMLRVVIWFSFRWCSVVPSGICGSLKVSQCVKLVNRKHIDKALTMPE